MSQARSHTHHSPVSGPASKYGGHPLDHTLSTYQNQNDRFKQLSGSHSTKSGTYPTKQQVSGSHSIKPGSRMNHTDVVVNSKVIPSKQYTTLLDQSNQECVSEPLPLNPLESGGDLGVRECPSGASSPSSGTPNNTLSKSGKIPYHMDPLASSASENRLGGHPGGPNRGGYHDAMETHSDSNLLDYSSSHYTEVGMASRGQGKVKQPHKMMAGSSVKGSSSDWEVRGDHGDHEGALPGRVLHPISKERVKVGGEQGVASPVTNGYAGVGKGILLLTRQVCIVLTKQMCICDLCMQVPGPSLLSLLSIILEGAWLLSIILEGALLLSIILGAWLLGRHPVTLGMVLPHHLHTPCPPCSQATPPQVRECLAS